MLTTHLNTADESDVTVMLFTLEARSRRTSVDRPLTLGDVRCSSSEGRLIVAASLVDIIYTCLIYFV